MSGPSYRFRLERVRALRERREDEAKQRLAVALQGRMACAAQLEEAARTVAAARTAQLQAGPQDLLTHQAYLERVEQTHRERGELLKRHDATVFSQRAEVVRASQDRQALERLKQRRLEEHLSESFRIEQITLDEIAGNDFCRRAA